jgi:hypothetical protein
LICELIGVTTSDVGETGMESVLFISESEPSDWVAGIDVTVAVGIDGTIVSTTGVAGIPHVPVIRSVDRERVQEESTTEIVNRNNRIFIMGKI